MRIVSIVQARMGATRLPGKVLLEVLDRSLLAFLVERLRRVTEAAALVIATTDAPGDDPIAEACASLSVPCFRGSETDVLARYQGAAAAHDAEGVVRITADCPLIDPAVVDRVIHQFKTTSPRPDYASNTLERTYPRGMDCEVLSREALEAACAEASDPGEREHVTLFVYRRPSRFHLANVAYDRDESRHRWTVDTPEDFDLVRRLLETLYPIKPDFGLEDLLRLLADHPQWFDINRHVHQKVT